MATNQSISLSSTLSVNIKIYASLVSILALASVVMNSLFLLVLIKKRSLRSPSNTLLGLLSFTDLMTGLTGMPLSIVSVFEWNNRNYRQILINLATGFNWMFIGLSYLLIIMISFDRYFAICHPFRYLRLASCRLFLGISGCSCLLYIPFGLTAVLLSSSEAISIYILFFDVSISVMVLGLVFANLKVFLVMKKQRNLISCAIPRSISQLPSREREKARTYVIFLLTAVFLGCLSPFVVVVNVHQVIAAHSRTDFRISTLFLWSVFLSYLNTVFNPLIYYFRITYFRDAIMEVIYQSWHNIVIVPLHHSR